MVEVVFRWAPSHPPAKMAPNGAKGQGTEGGGGGGSMICICSFIGYVVVFCVGEGLRDKGTEGKGGVRGRKEGGGGGVHGLYTLFRSCVWIFVWCWVAAHTRPGKMMSNEARGVVGRGKGLRHGKTGEVHDRCVLLLYRVCLGWYLGGRTPPPPGRRCRTR